MRCTRAASRPAQLQMQRSGLLTATAKLVAQGETVGTTTAAGTPAEPALKRFGHFNGSITRNGTALGNVVSAEITYANNLDRIETIRSDGKIDGADPSIAALTGRVEVRFADQVLVDQAIAGDPCELEFGYTLPSGESFTFTVHAVYLPRPRIEIAGPQGVQATFDWQAARDTGVGRMCSATLVNDVEAYLGRLDTPSWSCAQATDWLSKGIASRHPIRCLRLSSSYRLYRVGGRQNRSIRPG